MGASRISRVLVAGVAVAALSSVSCGSDEPSTPKATQVYVSLVDKGRVDTFLNRLATADGHVVATRAPVAGARQSAEVRAEQGASLYLVEGPLPQAPVPGERARVGGFAVVAVPSPHDPHEWLGSPRYFAEPIAEREIVAPSPPPPAAAWSAGPAVFEGELPDIPIDEGFLEARLRELSGATPVSVDGRTVTIRERGSSGGRAQTRAWLRQQYEALGFTVSEQTYAGSYSGPGGVNLIADKAGADRSRVLVVSAHYDSVHNAGADDDASGVVSALAIARALEHADLAVGLRFVAFDQEEQGLLGSKAYAQRLSERGELRQIVGVLNLEMTAYDSDDDGHYHVIDCDENTSAELTARVVEAAGSGGDLSLTKVDACTSRSDHASFWRYDVPAVVVSEDFFGGDDNPCYHASCDRIDRLNLDYMRRLTQAVAITVARLALAAEPAP